MSSILVIDDNDYIRASLTRFLEKENFNVIGCANGSRAIEEISNMDNDITLVICDVIMPEVDGFEVIDFIEYQRKQGRYIGIIMMSGGGGEIDATTALESLNPRVDHILRKPFTKQDLIKNVYRLMSDVE